MGKVKMLATEYETAMKVARNRSASRTAELGGFVLGQMMPDMWYVKLAVGGARFILHAMESLYGDTLLGLVRMLLKALLGRCVEYFRSECDINNSIFISNLISFKFQL
ncbi:hypothetical protein Syun_004536 [Stephania yunnanensis]|uniref:Uncharacterized protein n=1 Tax=Stephania yunnanensis TaxID=152371 RepID=A0AAP0L7D6_9MAGN